jgi:soluble lytic murein transglycosylase-like protein
MARARHVLICACVLSLAATQASAGDAAQARRSPYRLTLEDPASFRLNRADLDQVGRRLPAGLAGKPYALQIERAARRAAIDPVLVHAVIAVESGYDASARSPKGALGLMQVMPQTALRYGVRDPARSADSNLGVGTRYLSDLLTLFEGNLELALAAYNAGERAVIRHGDRIPPYRETQRYVEAVSQTYRRLRFGSPAARAEYLRGTRLGPATAGTFTRSTLAPRWRRDAQRIGALD